LKGKGSASAALTQTATIPVMTVTPVSTPPPPTPTAVDQHAANQIELTLSADTSIEGVRAQGMRSVSLDGKHAKLVVATWTGSLTVDATLAGGRPARAVADATGSRELHLDPLPPRVSRGVPRPEPPAAGAKNPELQESPYGPP